MSRAAIVTVTYESESCIGALLESVRRHEGSDTEVVVVDNASRDGTRELIERGFAWVRVLPQARNLGFAAAVNHGVAATTAEYVMLLNPDGVLTEGVLSDLADFMAGDPSLGAVGPKVLHPDGTLQASCRRFPTMWSGLFNRTSLLTRLLPSNALSGDYLMADFDHASTLDVDWLSGAALMLRREAFERVGGMDQAYFIYFEDVDLCQRLHRAGFRVVYYPHVSVVHEISASSGGLANRTIRERHRGMWRYWTTYRRGNSLRDAAAWGMINARCAAQLAANTARRRLNRPQTNVRSD